jgi:hypothetical protein
MYFISYVVTGTKNCRHDHIVFRNGFIESEKPFTKEGIEKIEKQICSAIPAINVTIITFQKME